MSSIDQQFIEYVVKSLVSNPDAVQVERRIDEKGVLLELTVDPEDLGRVIGKRGATAQSLRTLLRALGTKNDARYNLKIIDNGIGSNHSSQPATTDDKPSSDDRSHDNDEESSDNGTYNDDVHAEEGSLDDSKADEAESADSDIVEESEHNDVVSKTRQELEDLDDLDV
jgi:predicted RNA-binding protein YlqC (UPF0109 family)